MKPILLKQNNLNIKAKIKKMLIKIFYFNCVELIKIIYSRSLKILFDDLIQSNELSNKRDAD